jgi:hypothetical protein
MIRDPQSVSWVRDRAYRVPAGRAGTRIAHPIRFDSPVAAAPEADTHSDRTYRATGGRADVLGTRCVPGPSLRRLSRVPFVTMFCETTTPWSASGQHCYGWYIRLAFRVPGS